MTQEQINKAKTARKTRKHASIGLSGALAYIIVTFADLPPDVDAEAMTAAVGTVITWIMAEAVDR